jgi:hypothetical protein
MLRMWPRGLYESWLAEGGSAASYEFAGARVYTYKDLVRTMQRDNIASADCPGLSSLDIAPTEIETLLSAFMDRG